MFGCDFLASLCDRLLDFDENVRKQVVAVICDVACHAPNAVPLETVKLVAERLRDKSVCMHVKSKILFFLYTLLTLMISSHCISYPCFSLHFQLLVKKYTMERLAEIYKVFCEKSSDTVNPNEYDWIPGKILRCFYDKDFR